MSLFEAAIITFITLSILWHVWKGGAANPEGTGSLGRKVSGLSTEVAALSGKVRHVEAEMIALKKEAATTKDIEKLEELVNERLNTVKTLMGSHKELSEATGRNVQRIYDIMLERGLSAK